MSRIYKPSLATAKRKAREAERDGFRLEAIYQMVLNEHAVAEAEKAKRRELHRLTQNRYRGSAVGVGMGLSRFSK